jgi:rhodanese-related sulfurtransferase
VTDSHPTELPADATLLDVREDGEWRAGHAPDAVHIPMSAITERVSEIPEGCVYVICRSGHRSAQVAAWLVAQGHEAVNVAGGMQAWAASGLPMIAEGGAAPGVL